LIVHYNAAGCWLCSREQLVTVAFVIAVDAVSPVWLDNRLRWLSLAQQFRQFFVAGALCANPDC
tara:strand:- start:277 stop:468 length:192 start_codon:yes stop_codon:yes gene_type:complete